MSPGKWLIFFCQFVDTQSKFDSMGDTVCKLNIFHQNFSFQKLILMANGKKTNSDICDTENYFGIQKVKGNFKSRFRDE